LPGKPFVSHRITQLYPTGVCIYFTYGIYTRGVKDEAHVASVADHRLRGAIIQAGGAISNHHGIGKFRSDFLKARLPESNQRVIRSMKTALDPNNVFGIQNGVFHRDVFKD
jgi:alkyldihydroxyacetonephosphate synthase